MVTAEHVALMKRLHREAGHDTRLTGCRPCHEQAAAALARPRLRLVR